MTVIKPTVGRIVHYRPTLQDPGPYPHGGVLAAQVCAVWGDRMVNLDIVDANGKHYAKTSVPLLQEGDPIPSVAGGYCEWMKYQLDQAKKHDTPPTKAAADTKAEASGWTKPPEPVGPSDAAIDAAAAALYELDPVWEDHQVCPVVGPVGDPIAWDRVLAEGLAVDYLTQAEAALSAAAPYLR